MRQLTRVCFALNRAKGIRYKPWVLQNIFQQLVIPLIRMREKGILQGDIKPDNILLDSVTRPTRAVFCDFGGARNLPKNFVSMRVR
jgi:serine/threonine protein kinase